jgi:hypothetical protein
MEMEAIAQLSQQLGVAKTIQVDPQNFPRCWWVKSARHGIGLLFRQFVAVVSGDLDYGAAGNVLQWVRYQSGWCSAGWSMTLVEHDGKILPKSLATQLGL